MGPQSAGPRSCGIRFGLTMKHEVFGVRAYKARLVCTPDSAKEDPTQNHPSPILEPQFCSFCFLCKTNFCHSLFQLLQPPQDSVRVCSRQKQATKSLLTWWTQYTHPNITTSVTMLKREVPPILNMIADWRSTTGTTIAQQGNLPLKRGKQQNAHAFGKGQCVCGRY